jgi:23S rRNA (uracil1939-C5)-methyltransferase
MHRSRPGARWKPRNEIAPLFEGSHGTGDVELATSHGGAPVVEIRFKGTLPPAVYARLEAAVNRGALRGARLFAGEVTRPVTVGNPTPSMIGADDAPLTLAPGGFAQASEAANIVLANRVASLCAAALSGEVNPKVVELYAGAATSR